MQAALERLRERRAERGDEGGFTLIELLIVVVILGILAAIVVFAVVGVTGSSAQSACRSDWKTVESAANAYKAQLGTWPSAVSALGTTTTDSNSATVGPWLNSADLNTSGVLINGNHYEIQVNNSGVVQVYKTDGVTKILPGGSGGGVQSDCNGVS